MRILYPYNEILPTRKAHDVYIYNACASLAEAGCEVHLLSGSGSQNKENLKRHYHSTFNDSSLFLHRLPIIRKNNFLNLSWNYPYFRSCQKCIEKERPDWVFLSVLKQAAFHLSRKVKNVRYVYEVHELRAYPNQKEIPLKKVAEEREILEKADLITVTTSALKEILRSPLYKITTPIEVVPLAAKSPLPPPLPFHSEIIVTYVGQLYKGQGIDLLLQAMKETQGIILQIVGGKREEISFYRNLSEKLGIEKKVKFLGFLSPAELGSVSTHAYVAPFENSGRMPFVAHTKLLEYAHSLCPFIAPNIPYIAEEFREGTLLFEPGNTYSLAEKLLLLREKAVFNHLKMQCKHYKNAFTWDKRAVHIKEILSQNQKK